MQPGNKPEKGKNGKGDKSLDGFSPVEHHGADHAHDQKVKMQVGLQAISKCSFNKVDESATNMKEKSLLIFFPVNEEEGYQTGKKEKPVVENSCRFMIIEVKRRVAKHGYSSQQGNQVTDPDLAIECIRVFSSNSVVEYPGNHRIKYTTFGQ